MSPDSSFLNVSARLTRNEKRNLEKLHSIGQSANMPDRKKNDGNLMSSDRWQAAKRLFFCGNYTIDIFQVLTSYANGRKFSAACLANG